MTPERFRGMTLTELGRAYDQLERECARLREETLTDHLTGVGSRRALDARLIAETARALRYGTPLILAAIDLDHFKRVNDAFGHEKGDLVLQVFGRVLKDFTRADDFAGRAGGEEFALVLTGGSATGAMTLIDRLRRAAARRTEQTCGVRVTASVGLAAWTPGMAAADLARQADGALYVAKRSRDCARAAWDQET